MGVYRPEVMNPPLSSYPTQREPAGPDQSRQIVIESQLDDGIPILAHVPGGLLCCGRQSLSVWLAQGEREAADYRETLNSHGRVQDCECASKGRRSPAHGVDGPGVFCAKSTHDGFVRDSIRVPIYGTPEKGLLKPIRRTLR
jgi:hypothetical protein